MPHQAQDALAGDADGVAHTQAGPDLAVAFAPDPAALPEVVVYLTPLIAYEALLGNATVDAEASDGEAAEGEAAEGEAA
jgi:hypothetical protein